MGVDFRESGPGILLWGSGQPVGAPGRGVCFGLSRPAPSRGHVTTTPAPGHPRGWSPQHWDPGPPQLRADSSPGAPCPQVLSRRAGARLCHL